MNAYFGTRRVAIAILVSSVSLAAATLVHANPMPGSLESAEETTTLVAQVTIASAGTFVAAEAPTTGSAQIVIEDGQAYLEIDSAFSTTDMAPDLHVLLETAEIPPSSYQDFGTYINLGSLQTVTGAQRYPIPDSIDLAEFKSVVIWCRTANATMGYASLADSQQAGAIR